MARSNDVTLADNIEKSFAIKEGSKLENYQIVSKLGAGGMGAVYKAKDTSLNRLVAIKFLLVSGGTKHERLLKRFLREAEISASLVHPNIIQIYNGGVYQENPYLVMEYVDGSMLIDYVEKNKCSLEEILRIVAKIADALHYAHTKNIIHRDVKPSNIMVRPDGEPVLMDFGIAKMLGSEERSLTVTGEFMGSPQYMSPEQVDEKRRDIDARTDVYGLGAVMYQLLTGYPPVEGDSLINILYQVLEVPPELPRAINPEIPEVVEQICMTALEKKKEARHQSASIFASKIRRYLKGETTHVEKMYHHTQKMKKWTRYYQFHKKRLFVIFSSIFVILIGVLFVATSILGFQFGLQRKVLKSTQEDMKKKKDNSESHQDLINHAKQLYKDKECRHEALWHVSRAIEKCPAPAYYQLKGQWLYESGYLPEAYQNFGKTLQSLQEKREDSSDNVPNLQNTLSIDEIERQMAEIAEKLKLYDKSYQHYEYVYKKNEKDSNILAKLGKMAFCCQDYEKALEHLNRAIPLLESIKPLPKEESMSYTEALYYRGKIWAERGKWDEAEKDWSQALTLSDVEQENIRKNLGKLYANKQEFKTALSCLEKIPNYSLSSDITTQATLAKCYFETHQWNNATDTFSRCIEIEPWGYDYYYNRALCYQNLRKFEEAERDINACIQLKPEALRPYIQLIENSFEADIFENILQIQMLLRSMNYLIPEMETPDLCELEKGKLQALLSYERKQEQPSPWNEKKYAICINGLLENESQSVRDICKMELLSMHQCPEVYNKLYEEWNNQKDQKKQKVEEILSEIETKFLGEYRRYLVRLYSNKDRDALKQIYQKGLLGRRCLLAILKEEKEESLMRFWAACALADLKTPEAHDLIETEACESNNNLAVRLFSEAARIRIFSDRIFDEDARKDLQLAGISDALFREAQKQGCNAYVRAIAARYVPLRYRNILENFLAKDEQDIRVRLYAAQRLHENGNEAGSKELLKGLSNPDPEIRAFCFASYWCFEALEKKAEIKEDKLSQAHYKSQAQKTKANISYLLDALTKPDPDLKVRRIAMTRLGRIDTASSNTIDAILKYLQDKDQIIRLQSIILLGKKDVHEPIIQIFFNTKEPFLVRAIAAITQRKHLVSLDMSELLKVITKLQNDPESKIRIVSALQLGWAPANYSIPILKNWSKRKDEATKIGCIQGMCNQGDIGFISRLEEMLRDESLKVRQMAASAIIVCCENNLSNMDIYTKKYSDSSLEIRKGIGLGCARLTYRWIPLPDDNHEPTWNTNVLYLQLLENFCGTIKDPKTPWLANGKDRSLEDYEKCFTEALNFDPENVKFLLERGIFYCMSAIRTSKEQSPEKAKGLYEKSIQDFQKAQKLIGDKQRYSFKDLLVLRWLAFAYTMTGQNKEAAELLEKLMSYYPWDVELRLAFAYIMVGQNEPVSESLKKLVSCYPSNYPWDGELWKRVGLHLKNLRNLSQKPVYYNSLYHAKFLKMCSSE